jgi:uncharacterized protein (TIGR03067 family)
MIPGIGGPLQTAAADSLLSVPGEEVLVNAVLDPDRVREEAARKDKERLQGVWNFVSGKRQAELLVSGDHFTMRFRNGDLYVGRFTVDPTNKPRAMDLVIEDGPEPYRGKTSMAIYEFDGDHLIWCPSTPGGSQRMRAFPPDDDPEHLCIIFRRQKKSP